MSAAQPFAPLRAATLARDTEAAERSDFACLDMVIVGSDSP